LCLQISFCINRTLFSGVTPSPASLLMAIGEGAARGPGYGGHRHYARCDGGHGTPAAHTCSRRGQLDLPRPVYLAADIHTESRLSPLPALVWAVPGSLSAANALAAFTATRPPPPSPLGPLSEPSRGGGGHGGRHRHGGRRGGGPSGEPRLVFAPPWAPPPVASPRPVGWHLAAWAMLTGAPSWAQASPLGGTSPGPVGWDPASWVIFQAPDGAPRPPVAMLACAPPGSLSASPGAPPLGVSPGPFGWHLLTPFFDTYLGSAECRSARWGNSDWSAGELPMRVVTDKGTVECG